MGNIPYLAVFCNIVKKTLILRLSTESVLSDAADKSDANAATRQLEVENGEVGIVTIFHCLRFR